MASKSANHCITKKRVGVVGSKLAVVTEWYENAKDSLCSVKFIDDLSMTKAETLHNP
jgi:hypothetical protein